MGTGLAGSSGGALTPMLGRIDSNNRLNIFDNQSAIPTTRFWVGYLAADGQDPHVRLAPGFLPGSVAALNPGTTGDITGRNDVSVFRLGAEYAFTPRFSISAQGQHVWAHDVTDSASDWTNPQLMFKHIILRTPDVQWSGVAGVNFEVGTDPYTINDTHSRLFLGSLYYTDIGQKWYSQGGVNFTIPTGQDVATFDWTVGFGWWWYRHPQLIEEATRQVRGRSGRYGGCGGCGGYDFGYDPFLYGDGYGPGQGFCRGGCPHCGSRGPFILGVTPSFYFLGKHAMGDNDSFDPFNGVVLTDATGAVTGIPGTTVGQYEEPRHVVDFTLGGTIHMRHGLALNLAWSFPVTGPNARRDEFLMALNWYY